MTKEDYPIYGDISPSGPLKYIRRCLFYHNGDK